MTLNESDSDSSYDDDGPPLQHGATCRSSMNLRNTSRIKPPARYRDDLVPVDPGRPVFVHPDPVFNMDRAYFVQPYTLELDEPSPGEAKYKLWQEQGEPRDAFGRPIVPSFPSREQAEVERSPPPGPTVAHLRRQSAVVRPDLTQSVVDTIEYRDAFDEAFEKNLADFEDDNEPQSNGGNLSRLIHPQPSTEYKDWSALSENVQWAIVHDLAHDHQDGIATAANLLGLTMSEVIDFVNLYLREKALSRTCGRPRAGGWENGRSQVETAHPAGALSQRDGEQHDHVQPVSDAEADQIMQGLEHDHRYVGSGATQNIAEAEIDQLPGLESVCEIWHEPDTELFLEANSEVAAEEPADQIGTEQSADQPTIQTDEEHAPLENMPPLVELVTDSFSREDIASGRGFLTFVGLQEYADRLGEWFGRGTSFHEISGIFDENNELAFSTEDTEKALHRGNELDWEETVPQPMKDPAQREWLMEAHPDRPTRHRQLINLPLQQGQALAGRKSGASHPPRFPQLPPFLQPHQSIVEAAGKAAAAFASLDNSSSQVPASDQASQAQPWDATVATPNPRMCRSVEASSYHDAQGIAENDTREARVTVDPVSCEVIASAAQSDAQGAADSGQFSENEIVIEGFPKCSSCFTARARCNGGRPCTSCVVRNRKCKDVTKADLDKFPERAVRVIKDNAKTDAKAVQDEGEAIEQATAFPAPAVSNTTTSRVKRKHSAIAGDAMIGEDGSDLDRFPPEADDPKDSDYDSTPKKKRAKKGNTRTSKKQATSKETPATSTPAKRVPRRPFKTKPGESTPKSNEPVAGAPAPTTQLSGNSLGGSALVKPAHKKPAKAPAIVKHKSPGLSRDAGEGSLLGAETGKSVDDSAEAVRHAGDKFRKTSVRPVPSGKRGETHSVPDLSSISSNPSGAGAARYLDIPVPFALAGFQTHSPTHGVARRMPTTPISRPISGLSGATLCASPSQGAYPMPGARGHLIPLRPQAMSAEDDQLSGAEILGTASTLNAPMALHEKPPVATESMLQESQIVQPGLSGSPGATEISPRSQSSGPGTTVSMDFLSMPHSPAQDSPAFSYGSISGSLPQSRLNYRSISGLSTGFFPGMVSLGSPTALQGPLSVSSHINGAHTSATSVPSPMNPPNPGFAVAPGLMSPYAMFPQQRPIPRPVSRLHQGLGYPVHQQSVQSCRTSGLFRDHQSEEIRSGSLGVNTSPSSPVPINRAADAALDFGQQPSRKKSRTSDSPLAPPREARSWKDLARTQWATESQENQPEPPKSSIKPLFGGDGSYEVSFTQFTRIREQVDPEIQPTVEAHKINHSPSGTSEKR